MTFHQFLQDETLQFPASLCILKNPFFCQSKKLMFSLRNEQKEGLWGMVAGLEHTWSLITKLK